MSRILPDLVGLNSGTFRMLASINGIGASNYLLREKDRPHLIASL